ncbi:MAG: 50S ribosomal protein L3 [Planctomycetes bacterium]|nr:50S ribosomal protein L3 [Planctomycetota bacterium]
MSELNELIGRKVGMTSVFDAQGAMVGVTVISVEPNVVLARRTAEKDGVDAAVLGNGTRKASRTAKPQAGQAAKAGVGAWPRNVKQTRVAGSAAIKAGDSVKVSDVFKAGEMVDVIGTSKGHGFQGVHKRHNFNLGPYTHGSKNYRETKSVGQNTFPARRWPGKRMAGHMGDVRRTVRNLRVVSVDAERNLILVNGPVPGADSAVVVLRRVPDRKAKA